MNKITSTEFQSNYQRLDEPVTVMARSRTLGTWYPKGTEPDFDGELTQAFAEARVAQELATKDAEIKYLKSELAKRLTTKVTGPILTNAIAGEQPRRGVRLDVQQPGFGHSTPAPKGN